MKSEIKKLGIEDRIAIAKELWKKVLEYIISKNEIPTIQIIHCDKGAFTFRCYTPCISENFLNVYDYKFMIDLFALDERTVEVAFDEKQGVLTIVFEWDTPEELS